MSTTLLEAAKTLVEAEKELRRASLAVREAHRSCATRWYGYCADSVCIDTENALDAAVRAELAAQKAALVEPRKLAETNAKGTLLRDKTVLFDSELRPSAVWQELAAKGAER